jgi:hypothetical protein
MGIVRACCLLPGNLIRMSSSQMIDSYRSQQVLMCELLGHQHDGVDLGIVDVVTNQAPADEAKVKNATIYKL